MKPPAFSFNFNNPLKSSDHNSETPILNRELSILNPRISIYPENTVKSQKKFTFSPFRNNPLFSDIPYNISPNPYHISIPRNRNNNIFSFNTNASKIETYLNGKEPLDFQNRLDRVCNSLSIIFNGENLNLEKQLIKSIDKKLVLGVIDRIIDRLLKKFQKQKRIKAKAKMTRIDQLRRQREYKSIMTEIFQTKLILIKRKEEKIKFIVKNTINYFKSQFFKNNNLKQSKESELLFLQFYFKEHKELYGYDYEHFSDPLNKIIPNPKFNSLSDDYFKLIFGVPSFKNAFINHLERRFKECYQKNIIKKFKTLFLDLYSKSNFENEEEFEKSIELAITRIQKEKSLKLPWTSIEIDNALDVFRKKIEKLFK